MTWHIAILLLCILLQRVRYAYDDITVFKKVMNEADSKQHFVCRPGTFFRHVLAAKFKVLSYGLRRQQKHYSQFSKTRWHLTQRDRFAMYILFIMTCHTYYGKVSTRPKRVYYLDPHYEKFTKKNMAQPIRTWIVEIVDVKMLYVSS